MKKPILICFPFAGGNKYSYNHFAKEASSIELLTVEYPGRGSRFNEMLLSRIEDIVEDVYCQILPYINNTYAFYGHSMGAIVSYLLTKKLVSDGLPCPNHLFLTGKRAPSLNGSTFQQHRLPRKEFLEQLRKMGGSSEEVLNNEPFMQLYEPIFRSDLQALELYNYRFTEKLDIPITIMYGTEEGISLDDAKAWQLETSKAIEIIEFPGNHFFINNFAPEIMKYIAQIFLCRHL